jgi:hypothetical protein
LNPIDIIVDVFDRDVGDFVSIEILVSNASFYTILNSPTSPVVSATITIKYTPKKGEFPVFT